jgi:hypothetical protein
MPSHLVVVFAGKRDEEATQASGFVREDGGELPLEPNRPRMNERDSESERHLVQECLGGQIVGPVQNHPMAGEGVDGRALVDPQVVRLDLKIRVVCA